jgi:hypothetical protein
MKRGYLWVFGVTGFLFIAIFIWGIAIQKICVAGNPDYEKGTGFCLANGRKDIALKKKKERLAKIKEEAEEKQRKDEEAKKKRIEEDKLTYITINYLCEEAIKSGLREPNSFEKIDRTFYGPPPGSKKKGVIIKYRARNGFGGMNVVSAACITETGNTKDLTLSGRTEN